MKTHRLALLSALVPMAALISGCGGGNGAGPNSSNNTPTTSPTFVAPSPGSPIFPTVTAPKTFLLLPSGQIAALDLTRNGGAAQGTLRVFNGKASNSSLDAGVYPLSGAFSAPTAFSVQSASTDVNRFTLSGSLPQDSKNGAFNFSLGKFNSVGTLLAPGQTVFPVSTPYVAVADLQFSNFTSSDPNAVAPLSVTPTGPAALSRTLRNGAFGYEILGDNISPRLDLQGTRPSFAAPNQQLEIAISLSPPASPTQANPNLLSAGQSFNLTPGVLTSGATPIININYAGRNYSNTSGTLNIKSVSLESVTLEFTNVRVATNGIPANSFVINGTFAPPVGVLSIIRLL